MQLSNGFTGMSKVEVEDLPWSPIYRVRRHLTVTLMPRRISASPVTGTGDTAGHYAQR